MVAVHAASPAPDADLASELGSLLLAHKQIVAPNWQLDAIVRRMPVVRRFGVSVDASRTAIRELSTRATCPVPMRAPLVELLCTRLDGDLAALAMATRALWMRAWAPCVVAALDVARRLNALDVAKRVIEIASSAPRARYWMRVLEPAPSLAQLITLVDTISETNDSSRFVDAERLAAQLRPRERLFATAHLGRLALRFGAPIRHARDASIRAGSGLLLVREAIAMDQLARASEIAEEIDRNLLREYAWLELARGLCRHGRFVDALRMLQRITRPELLADRAHVRAEIHLLVRRDRETYHPAPQHARWQLPSWLRGPRWLPTHTRDVVVTCAAVWRIGMRTDGSLPHTWLLDHEAARPAFLDLMNRAGVNVDAALALCRRRGVSVDACLADRIAFHAAELARSRRELPHAMERGLSGRQIYDVVDARSSERASFDEGIALSANARPRRRVLIGVARSCLRSALTQPAWPIDVVCARLRILVHLGGSLAADAIAAPLAELPIIPRIWLPALEALCALDPLRAGQLVIDRYGELLRDGADPVHLLELVVAAKGIDHDHARACVSAFRSVDNQRAKGAVRWFSAFVRLWLATTGTRPHTSVFAWLHGRDVGSREPQALLDELACVRTNAMAGTPLEVARRLADDEAALRAILLDPTRLDPRMTPWTIPRWKTLLVDAASTPQPALAIVHDFARRLGQPRWASALATGDLVRLGVAPAEEVAAHGHCFVVRLLDKRRDLLAYLRFADVPARSCFRSDTASYTDSRYPTRPELLAAWRDPLAFCFHIENDRGEACGFLFGSFAIADGDPAVVFNSLHVRPRNAELRIAILRAVERGLCAPLGIRHLAIANLHGGRGPLPSDYVQRTAVITRLRALSTDGEPIKTVDDDISIVVNDPVVTTDLHWNTIDRTHR
jgi:hypothetical protein